LTDGRAVPGRWRRGQGKMAMLAEGRR
jgi:hypothetical protein